MDTFNCCLNSGSIMIFFTSCINICSSCKLSGFSIWHSLNFCLGVCFSNFFISGLISGESIGNICGDCPCCFIRNSIIVRRFSIVCDFCLNSLISLYSNGCMFCDAIADISLVLVRQRLVSTDYIM